MESYAIQTSQNVTIEQAIASVGERIVAALLDMLFVGAYLILIMFLGTALDEPIVIFVLAIPIYFYHLILELTMGGQSWGKKIMKIKVVNTQGAQPGFFSFFLRWIFRLVDIAMLFGAVAVISVLVSKKGQRLGDMAAGTIIIRIRDKTIFNTLYTKLPDDYEINYPEVSKLDDNDLRIVKEVLDFLASSKKSGEAMLLADKTKKALETKMGVPAGVRSEHFLFKILRDYNYLHMQ